jgi:DNA invertase Pin-like site-specific DNA recombinase
MIFDLYVRLSIHDDTKDGLERQEADLRKWADAQGHTVRKVWRDAGISAYKPGVDRAAFKKAKEAVLTGEVPGLAVWRLDRLSRQGAGQVGLLMDHLTEVGSRIIFVSNGLDTSDESHRLSIILMSEQARTESKNTGRRIDDKNRALMQAGLPILGKRRFGYLDADKKTGRVVNTVEHPEEAPQLRALFSDYLAGESVVTLARKMGWRTLRVRETLSNPAYMGVLAVRGATYTAAEHVARLVDSETFNQAQARLIARSAAYKATNARGGAVKHLASGIAVCGVCGNTMSFRNSYLCLSDLSHPTIKREFLESAIREGVVKTLIDPGFAIDADPEAQSLREAQERITALEEDIQDVLSGLQNGLRMSQLVPHLQPLQREQQASQERVSILIQQSVQARLLSEITASIKRHLGTYPTGQFPTPMPQGTIVRWEFNKLSLDQKRELIRGLLTIIVNPGRGPERVTVERKKPEIIGVV